jgi:signal peptidase I
VKRSTFLDYAVVALAAVALALLLQAFVVKPYRIPSPSMVDTLRPGDRVLVNRVAYHLREPERGDIIVFRYPLDPGTVYIKRVVGLPGDTLELRDGRVVVNGNVLDEPYVHGSGGAPDLTEAAPVRGDGTMHDPWSLAAPFTVPADAYFVLGDNRLESDDSRFWGTVPRPNLIGVGFMTYWPVSRLGAL